MSRTALRLRGHRTPVRQIVRVVAQLVDATEAEILGHSRIARIAQARQLVMALAHEIAGRSHAEIGRALGRHHTTSMWACEAVRARLAESRFWWRVWLQACDQIAARQRDGALP